MRIRGQIGSWPVDLTIELEPGEWAQLGGRLDGQEQAQCVAAAAAPLSDQPQDDQQWATALDILRQAGQLSGPELLERLAGVAVTASASKRLLVRLRHSAQVRVVAGADAPLYCWQGDSN